MPGEKWTAKKYIKRAESMKPTRKLIFAGFAAVALALLVQSPIPYAAAQQNRSQGNNKHTLRLRVYFEQTSSTQTSETPKFGDQFTLAGPVALFDSPNQIIGRIALHLVATADGATETLLSGTLNLKDPAGKVAAGQISFAGLSPTSEPRIPGPITGGTGAYLGAKGQVAHLSPAMNVEELIFTFDDDRD
jgi:hypothetical protein